MSPYYVVFQYEGDVVATLCCPSKADAIEQIKKHARSKMYSLNAGENVIPDSITLCEAVASATFSVDVEPITEIVGEQEG